MHEETATTQQQGYSSTHFGYSKRRFHSKDVVKRIAEIHLTHWRGLGVHRLNECVHCLMSSSGLLRCNTGLDSISVLLLKIGQTSGGLVQARVLVLVQGGQSHITSLGIIGSV